MMMCYYDTFWGMNFIWWFCWIVLLIWIFVIPYDVPGQRRRRDTPADILKRKLANGEISTEEYLEKKKLIESDLSDKTRE